MSDIWQMHEHEFIAHNHRHYHVTHNWNEENGGFEHLSANHEHEHDHAALTHEHHPHMNFDYEHRHEAHIHDHEEALRRVEPMQVGGEPTATGKQVAKTTAVPPAATEAGRRVARAGTKKAADKERKPATKVPRQVAKKEG